MSALGLGGEGVAVGFGDAFNHLGMCERFVIDDGCFARHCEVFDWKGDERAFADFLVARVF